uniref:Uncharacterized protein n=1 Tax=Oryza punctata TaxID=4537 RepID=A0A0E0MGI2_ORYPU
MVTSAARAAKRTRIDTPPPPPPPTQLRRGDDDYVPGNIVEIELSNFMTYDRLAAAPAPASTSSPGPAAPARAPSFVLSPSPSPPTPAYNLLTLLYHSPPLLPQLLCEHNENVLRRASSVGAFVKRGEESGHVNISLRGNTPEHIIRITRKIGTNNKSEWQLDGITSSSLPHLPYSR